MMLVRLGAPMSGFRHGVWGPSGVSTSEVGSDRIVENQQVYHPLLQ